MATAANLANQGKLHRWRLPRDDRRQNIRSVYVTPDFRNWLETRCPDAYVDRSKTFTPREQVVNALDRLATDPSFPSAGMLVNIHPQGEGVYELKLTDVRILGFFPLKGEFVAVTADLKKNLKGNPQGVKSLKRQVVTARQHFALPYRRHSINVRNELL